MFFFILSAAVSNPSIIQRFTFLRSELNIFWETGERIEIHTTLDGHDLHHDESLSVSWAKVLFKPLIFEPWPSKGHNYGATFSTKPYPK